MKRFRVHLVLGLLMLIFAGFASPPAFRPFSPDPQRVAQGRVKDDLESLLRIAGRDPIGRSLLFFESRNLGGVPPMALHVRGDDGRRGRALMLCFHGC